MNDILADYEIEQKKITVAEKISRLYPEMTEDSEDYLELSNYAMQGVKIHSDYRAFIAGRNSMKKKEN